MGAAASHRVRPYGRDPVACRVPRSPKGSRGGSPPFCGTVTLGKHTARAHASPGKQTTVGHRYQLPGEAVTVMHRYQPHQQPRGGGRATTPRRSDRKKGSSAHLDAGQGRDILELIYSANGAVDQRKSIADAGHRSRVSTMPATQASPFLAVPRSIQARCATAGGDDHVVAPRVWAFPVHVGNLARRTTTTTRRRDR